MQRTLDEVCLCFDNLLCRYNGLCWPVVDSALLLPLREEEKAKRTVWCAIHYLRGVEVAQRSREVNTLWLALSNLIPRLTDAHNTEALFLDAPFQSIHFRRGEDDFPECLTTIVL